MVKKIQKLKICVLVLSVFSLGQLFAQQDAQYTQYMYNPLNINPAYAGQRNGLSIVNLNRLQWAGIEGAPNTFTIAAHSPLRNERLGLGVNVVRDDLGPASETQFEGNASYTLPLSDQGLKLSFGLKAGLHMLQTDWSEGRAFQGNDVAFANNLRLNAPIVGAGLYLSSYNWYFGLSVPNLLETNRVERDNNTIGVGTERMHFFAIAGYVFKLSESVQFKPAILLKAVPGAPPISDFSANFLYREKLTLGVAYRLEDAISILTAIRVSKIMEIGYAFDLTTSEIVDYTSGTHELMLRFEIPNYTGFISPRFF
jgi:type IX secretion system PorP/SprF family membrane protein